MARQRVQEKDAVFLGGPAGDPVSDAHDGVVLGHGPDEYLVVVIVAQGENVQALLFILSAMYPVRPWIVTMAASAGSGP